MMALAEEWTDSDRGGLLRWLVPASVALHVVVFAWLPSARRSVAIQAPPPVIEVAEPPAPPPPKMAEPPPVPEPSSERIPPRAAPAAAAAKAHVAPRDVAPASATPDVAPMDFTSTVFSNDGPGVALAGGGPRVTTTSAPVAPSRIAAPIAAAPPRVVPPSSLARRPRAPGLDTELERQYPAEARRSGISGNAVLRVRILPDGRIGEVHVVSESWTGFGPACERTVRAARWEPPIDRDGAPVATEITYTCRFEVRS